MNKTFLFIFTLGLLGGLGCNSQSEKQEAATSTASTTETPATTATPAKGDLLSSLQGKWQSMDDAKSVILIKNDDFVNLYDGEEVGKEKIGISAEEVKTCAASANAEIDLTKVFMTKGQFDATCFLVLAADAQHLEYTFIGGTGKSLKFKKI